MTTSTKSEDVEALALRREVNEKIDEALGALAAIAIASGWSASSFEQHARAIFEEVERGEWSQSFQARKH